MTKYYLQVQNYLLTHSLNDLIKEHGVYHRIHGHKMSLNYDQIEAKDNDPIAQECRGLILGFNKSVTDPNEVFGDTEVVAYPFKRFFNYGQDSAARVNFSNAKFYQKYDGCAHSDTKIITKNGVKFIKDICENKIYDQVLSYNILNNVIEYDKIIEFSIKENVNNWYELELEDGNTIILTGNHKIYLPKTNTYKKVEDLDGDEEFLICENIDI